MRALEKDEYFCWITGKPRETGQRVELHQNQIWEPDAKQAAQVYAGRIAHAGTLTVTVVDHGGSATVWDVSPIAETRYTAKRRREG